jgi:autotransporter-associated beta strand protein
MYNFARGGGRAPVESFRRKATARLFAAAALLFILVSGPTRAQAQDDGARQQPAGASGGGHHHKHKPQVGADPFWDPTNGTGAGTGTTTPNGTWSLGIAAWNAVAGGTGAVSVWNNGDAAVFSAGTDATGSYIVTVSAGVTASTITFEEGTVTLAGTAAPILKISGPGGITINSTINGTTTFDSSLGTVLLPDNLDIAWTNNSSQDFVVASGVKIGDKGTMTLGGSGSGTISGIISQASGSGAHQGALVKTGAGTFTLTGANTYSGSTNGTTVSAGTLLVNNTTGSGTGTGAVTVNSTGTLGGSGTISGTVTLNNSATINGGATSGAIGTLTTGALTLNNTSILSVDMTSAPSSDTIRVIGGISLATTSVLQLNITNGTTFTAGQVFTLFDNDASDPILGTFSNAPTGMDIINGYAWFVSYTGGTGNDFILTAVPEPSTWLAGALVLSGLICSQRRRIRSVVRRATRA